jgi:DNA-binding transcriptional LysR family regulator
METGALGMEMHQVRYFLAICETLNFTRAAERCHVSQPALTRAIKKLEEELGGPLFRRERNLTHLTELGQVAMLKYPLKLPNIRPTLMVWEH